VGSRANRDQFRGWRPSGGHSAWNSCTRGTWESPHCGYYNDAGCTEQSSDGPSNYGGGYRYYNVGCEYYDPYDGQFYGGCRDLDGILFGPYGNYLQLYELDTGCCDDFVTTLNYDDVGVAARLTCPDSYSCYGNHGSWIESLPNGTASAPIRVQVVGAWYMPHDTCSWGASIDASTASRQEVLR
jgi:hypothetical protein